MFRITYIRDIQDMYEQYQPSVHTHGEESDEFSIIIGLHQSSTQSPYLFTLILYVLLRDSKEYLNERLKTYRRLLKMHVFRLRIN